MKGRERSELQGLERLGVWYLRRFTGRYDDGGAAIWAEGQLLIDSIWRFKGQAALAVVLTECDLGDLKALNRRLLFVGLTRARMHLEWVISERMVAVTESQPVGRPAAYGVDIALVIEEMPESCVGSADRAALDKRF